MTEIDDVSVQAETPVAASVGDTLRVGAVVIVPTFAAGVIKRRPGVMALADRFQLDKPAIRLLQRLRRKYGAVPLSLRIPGRSLALLLSGDRSACCSKNRRHLQHRYQGEESGAAAFPAARGADLRRRATYRTAGFRREGARARASAA